MGALVSESTVTVSIVAVGSRSSWIESLIPPPLAQVYVPETNGEVVAVESMSGLLVSEPDVPLPCQVAESVPFWPVVVSWSWKVPLPEPR